MHSKEILLPALVLSISSLYLHLLALKNHLYFFYWWFDMLVHFITGLALVLTILFIVVSVSTKNNYSLLTFAKVGLPAVLFFSIGWEVFEFVNGLVFARYSYMIDTLIDLFMGLCGGMVGILYMNAIF
jgi:hypothetical protein